MPLLGVFLEDLWPGDLWLWAKWPRKGEGDVGRLTRRARTGSNGWAQGIGRGCRIQTRNSADRRSQRHLSLSDWFHPSKAPLIVITSTCSARNRLFPCPAGACGSHVPLTIKFRLAAPVAALITSPELCAGGQNFPPCLYNGICLIAKLPDCC